MFSHVTNCCNVIAPPPPRRGKRRLACGREEILGCVDTQTKGLSYSILDDIWSKPLWYHKRFEIYRLDGRKKPETYSEYEELIGITGFKTTDQFCEYDEKGCNAIYRAGRKNLAETYDFIYNYSQLLANLTPSDSDKPCVYPNCWISAAETNKAKCDNKYFKLIAHYPSIGRPFQTASSSLAEGLKNTNISPDSEPGRQVLSYTFETNSGSSVLPKKPRVVEGSHDKSIHQNTAYPGTYWISWWNGIHPGNIIGYENVDIFKNPFKEANVPLKLSEQIKCYHNGATATSYCAGITFIQQFEKQAKNKVKKLVTGWKHSCILTEDGKCFCWGDNSKGQTAVPKKYTDGTTPVTDIYCGGEYTLVLIDGILDGWGADDYGQLSQIPSDLKKYTTGIKIKKIATGGTHVVALMETDIKVSSQGKLINTKNTLRLWGDTSNNKTLSPRIAIKNTNNPTIDWIDFIRNERQYDSDGVPANPALDDITISAGGIIPWWPVLSQNGLTYYYGSVSETNGFHNVVKRYESSKNENDVFNEPISKDIEVLDVWAGKDHTVVLTKDINKVWSKTYNQAYDNFLKQDPGNTIFGYSPAAERTIEYGPKLQMFGYIPLTIEYSEYVYITTGTVLSNTKSIIDQEVNTNIFVWGKGMQMDFTTTNTSSNFDYNFYNQLNRVVRNGDTFPTIVLGDDQQYQIKTNCNSEHTVILGKKQLSFRKIGGSSCWTATAFNLWGWGDNSYEYIWDVNPDTNPGNDILPRANLNCGLYCSTCNDGNCNTTDYKPHYKNADCFYLPNMFVINPNNINYRLNLYKEGPDNFYQFAYLNQNGSTCRTKLDEDTDKVTNPGCSISLGGWTLNTELDINETSVDDLSNGIRNNLNSLMIRTTKGRTLLIERYSDQWTGTPDDFVWKNTCYGISCEATNDFFSQLTGKDIDFLEAGEEHLVSVQTIGSNNRSTKEINFPYKILEDEPRDRTSLTSWFQNGYNSPRIVNDPNYSQIKNEQYRQAIFDPFTSSRLYYNISIKITKEKISDGTEESLTVFGNNSVQLVGLRGDQRVKAFTGATCDCLWSDWATDPFKIGGHPGVILNETIHEAHDETKSTIPWDNYSNVPDRKYRIDQQGVKAINYYNAPPNVLTHNLIEIPPGKFPSELSLPCRKKYCEGGVNRTIKKWCDPCFAFNAGITLMKKLEAGEVWLGRLGCTGCEYNHGREFCQGCTLQGNDWICPNTAPKIREVYDYSTSQPETQINSFGEPSTPLEEAWPSLNRYLIPRWSNIEETTTSTKVNEWIINGSKKQEPLEEFDYPLVIVPAHGGNIGPKYDMEAYQDVALSASLGSIDEFANAQLLSNTNFGRIDTGVRYLNDFKDTEYPFYKWNAAYKDYKSPNGSTGSTAGIFYSPPSGVTFRISDIKNPQTGKLEPMCGDTEVGCSSCAIPFTGAETAAWGFDLYAPSVIDAIQSFLGLNGNPISDPEIGNISLGIVETSGSYKGGAWLGIAKDRFIDWDGKDKKRLRLMFPVNLKEGEVLSFGKKILLNNYSETKLGENKIKLEVLGFVTQYPNDTDKLDANQPKENYKYRWGRFNDECACSSRISISPEIFLVDTPDMPSCIKLLQEGKINELTNDEKASIIIGGKLTRGLGLVQYWNCNNPVTYLESGESPILSVNGWFKIGLCDLDNTKPPFLYNVQEFLADGANIATVPLNSNIFYRGEKGAGIVFDQFSGLCRPPTACPQYRNVNSPGIRGFWSGWLSEKGWSNFYTNKPGFDDHKDRVGGNIPLEASHPQGWLGHASSLPHTRRNHILSTRTDSSMSISSMSDLVNRCRTPSWTNIGFPGIASGIDSKFISSCGEKGNRAEQGGETPYSCSGGDSSSYNASRLQIYNAVKSYSESGPEFQNPKTQKLKACCFGDGFEHEVYSSVTKSLVPDTYSRIVKINKYRNLYNAMWHSHPINLQYINFRDWHGDPYSPTYCTGSTNCKSRYSPVWFDYWWPGVKDESSRGTVGPNGFNVFKNIMHWRHRRWDLPLFVGVNRDNIGNFYIHDPFNCGQNGPESCSGFELVDKSFPAIDSRFHKVGWDHRSYDCITAQCSLNPGSLYFFKTERGKAEATGRGIPIHYMELPGTFYSMNGSIWDSKIYELCVDSPTTDIFSGLYYGLINADLVNTPNGVCIVQDSSKWNNYYTHLGPGFARTEGINNGLINITEAKFTNVQWL